MYSTSKGKLGGNLLAIKNYIEKNGLDFKIKVVTALNPIPQNELAAEMAQSKFILVDDYEPLVYVLRLRQGQKLVQVWHAMGAFKRFGYGRDSAQKSSITHKNYTDAIVSSPEIVPIYAQAFGIDETRVKPVGTPRTDCFLMKIMLNRQSRDYTAESRLSRVKKFAFSRRLSGERMCTTHIIPKTFSACLILWALCRMTGCLFLKCTHL